MKYLTVVSTVFFLVINTSYFWEPVLGDYSMLIAIVLILIYAILFFSLISQFYNLVAERFRQTFRIRLVILMSAVLSLTAWKPSGIIDFTNFGPENILVAWMEGAAGCETKLSLRADSTFIQRVGCFGVSYTKGKYTLRNDTIFFSDASVKEMGQTGFYRFAIVHRPSYPNGDSIMELACYKNGNDSVAINFRILGNKLQSVD